MQPKLTLLDDLLIERVLEEAISLLQKPGIKVQNDEARNMLADCGCTVNEQTQVVIIPEILVSHALTTVPSSFILYDYYGNPKVQYGGDVVQFDPGSSGINILDPNTLEHKEAVTQDFVNVIKVVEGLNQYDAQSTAIVCSDVPKEIQDLYRLYLVLIHSQKPIVTGSFSNKTLPYMIEMLNLISGGEGVSLKPRAIFDVCPTPPLVWSNFGAGNLMQLARAGVPAEIVSMPLAGAAAPVTLIGSVVQHTAECLAGITIHQLASPGSPIVWGGAPAIFDMRKGATPMGAIETAMIDCSYAQVGKRLNIPTHAYLGGTDSKVVDSQAGIENAMGTLIGALSGINMISGAGMIDSLLCMSPEKLVIDAESIAMARRFIEGINLPTDSLATGFYEGINFKGGDFLKQKITLKLFKKEQYLPGPIIDRDSMRGWVESGSMDMFGRAKLEVNKLLTGYAKPQMDLETLSQLNIFVTQLARLCGMNKLPDIK